MKEVKNDSRLNLINSEFSFEEEELSPLKLLSSRREEEQSLDKIQEFSPERSVETCSKHTTEQNLGSASPQKLKAIYEE